MVVSDDLPESALEILRAEGWQVDARTGRKPDELAQDLADADALIVRSATKVTKDLLAAAPRLRIIGRAGSGVDNIDMPAASGRGVLVVNAPGANSISVAEQALRADAVARALGAGRRPGDEGRQVGKEEVHGHRAPRQDARHRRPRPHRPGSGGPRALVRHDASSPTTRTSRRTWRTASASSCCRSTSCAPSPTTSRCTCRRHPRRRTCFNDERFAKCKPGIRIINTARGELIDEAALRRAIESGIVGGAGIDVFQKEPPVGLDARRSSRRWSPRRTSRRRPKKRRNWSASTPPAAVRDFLRDGVVRNAVNFPSVPSDELQRLQPWMRLADGLAAVVSQMGPGARRPDRRPLLRRAGRQPGGASCLRRAPRPACCGRSCRAACRW